MGKKQFCFFQTAETGNRTPDSGVKGSGANHYPRAPARIECRKQDMWKWCRAPRFYKNVPFLIQSLICNVSFNHVEQTFDFKSRFHTDK